MVIHSKRTELLRTLIGTGYLLICLLIAGIMYLWFHEWQEVEALEVGNRRIDEFRKEVNCIHIRLIEFSLLGETVLEWDETDLENYHTQRIALDSTLCLFNKIHSIERIDSVRSLLEDKERQMFQIIRLIDVDRQGANNPNRKQPAVKRYQVYGERRCVVGYRLY